jgi:hypothetical protein
MVRLKQLELIFVVLGMACLPIAHAQGAATLAPENAMLDLNKAADKSSSPVPAEGMMLYGSVKRHQSTADQNRTDAALQADQASADQSPVFALALQKLAKRQKLSAEEYRSDSLRIRFAC